MRRNCLVSKEKCAICNQEIEPPKYYPMKDWNIDGELCGECYSKKIFEFYPGEHIRVNKDLD